MWRTSLRSKFWLLAQKFVLGVASMVAALGISGLARAQPFEWLKATPESQGMSAMKLKAIKDSLAARKTKAFLVIRNDQIVYEWYADGHSATKPHYSASLAKAIVGGLSLAVALSDERIALDDKAAKFIPQWKDDPRKNQITMAQLGSHTSGLSDAETLGIPHNQLIGWKGDFWKRLDPPNDPFSIARDKTPTIFEPGKKMRYSNPGIAMLTYATTAALKGAPENNIRNLLRDRVMRPIGVPDKEWSVGYGKTFMVDELPLVGTWGGANFSARAAARVGRLMLREGDWDGKQLIRQESVRLTTTDPGLPGNCGMGWWTNNGGEYARLPADAYWGSGAGHQIVLVVPSLELIVVRNGDSLANVAPDPEKYHEPVRALLFEPLIDAIVGNEPTGKTAVPYGPSKIITQVEWAPQESIIRQAKGSDNWPLTWADDDHLYTAYGDGNGFEPFVPQKLGLGIARIEGGPASFTGANIGAPTVENREPGNEGKKASGMLMVDGVLYLWARNADNSQLAWSNDHGNTWEWAEWKFTTSFGCPTFLNFGKNYAGARDNFVYIYSHDAESAYQPANGMVLARVPKGKIKKQSAYEFFKGLDSEGGPIWAKIIAERGAVFTHEGRCYRSGISYNVGLKRYLWVQIIPGSEGKQTDTRFAGGFAVYDAPEPWGPWTTVFFTEQWDVGPGETANFPTKWMSADGKEMVLVFSGDDHFSTRKLSLTLSTE